MKHIITGFLLTLATVVNCNAAVIYSPSSIVDHGTYITDTISHLDWYKFDNVVTTVGLSIDDTRAQFTPLGWEVAGLDEVQVLESRFGWTGDTPTLSFNANYGLTDAMSAFLGHTLVGSYIDNNGFNSVFWIRAMTWDAICWIDGVEGCIQNVTRSEYQKLETPTGDVGFFGDYVAGSEIYQAQDLADSGVGTWLVRASAPATGCDTGATNPCVNEEVPEPASITLAALGLIGLVASRRKAC